VGLFVVHRESCFSPRVASGAEDQRSLQVEARLIARYLLGRVPSQELVERYEEANRALFTGPVDQEDAAVIGFVSRHPWSVPFMDAASGLLRPDGMLRGKILTMGAILETSPEFADEFLPRTVRPTRLLLRLFVLGLAAAAYIVLGTLLYAVAIRSRA